MGNNNIELATESDKDWIKKIYSESKDEIGSFNLFYSWDDYLKGKGKFLVIRPKAFVRIVYSVRNKAYVVHEIAVAKEFKGQGLAEKLMKEVSLPVMLKCNQNNKTGNYFYEKIGMKKVGETKTKKGNPQNIYLCVDW